MPLISVLIPCFNVSEYLDETMASLLAQTEKRFEVLLLDDGSTDNTSVLLQQWQAVDPRIRVLTHEQNKGIIAARNTLLSEAKGEFLAWLDADDIARADRLEKQYAYLNSDQKAVAVSCEYVEFDDVSEVYRARQARDVSADALLFYNYVLNPGSMVRSDVIHQHGITFDESLAGASDYQFWVDVSKVGKIGMIHEPLMRYRRHEAQESTAQIGRQLRGCQQIVLRQLEELGITGMTTDDMAQFLIYPADILKLPYSTGSMKKSCHAGRQLLRLLPQRQYGDYAKELTLHLLRRHAVRSGIAGLFHYISVAGLTTFLQGRHFGLSLFMDCLRKKY